MTNMYTVKIMFIFAKNVHNCKSYKNESPPSFKVYDHENP